MRSARWTALVTLLLLAACSTPREEGSVAPAPGESAPALDLSATTGGAFSLGEATKERTVVVVFYRGTF